MPVVHCRNTWWKALFTIGAVSIPLASLVRCAWQRPKHVKAMVPMSRSGLSLSAYVHRSSLLGPGAPINEWGWAHVVALFHGTTYTVSPPAGRVACFLLLRSRVGAMLSCFLEPFGHLSQIYTSMSASTPCSMRMYSFARGPRNPKVESAVNFVTSG
jgi:hypothetical protein